MSDQFTVQIQSTPAAVVVSLQGDAACTEVEHLRDRLRPVFEHEPKRVVLDLSKLMFINSLGLGALIEFRKELGLRGAHLHLAGATKRIADVFQKTRLVEIFPMFDSAEQALAADS